jgi:hypothetical protein
MLIAESLALEARWLRSVSPSLHRRRPVMKERDDETHKEQHEEGWTPDAPTGEEALKTEERSLDIGEHGQFAPGGYYNQQGVSAPERLTLDDDMKKW